MSFGYSVTAETGRVRAGEVDYLWAPRTPRTGTCGVVLCHGATSPAQYMNLLTQSNSVKLAAALASAGIPCIAGEFSGDSWGNDAAMTDVTNAWGVLQAAYPDMRTDKVALLGASMGAAVIARWSQLNPTQTAAVVGIIPLWDLVAFYQGDVGGLQSSVAAAWGVTAPAALPAGADIAANASLAAGIPHLAGYSTTDALIDPDWVTAYTAAVGGTAQVTNPNSGHTNASIGGLPIATIGRFLAANGC